MGGYEEDGDDWGTNQFRGLLVAAAIVLVFWVVIWWAILW